MSTNDCFLKMLKVAVEVILSDVNLACSTSNKSAVKLKDGTTKRINS